MNKNLLFEAAEIFGVNNRLFDEMGNPRFMDENYYKKHHFNFTNKLEVYNRSNHICIFPGCNNKSIKFSHTIPLSGVLSILVKPNNHLYTPHLNIYKNIFEFKKKGINRASTFPGFCTEHEKIFNFESPNNFLDDSIQLQNFRAVLRDLYFLQSRIKLLEKESARYEEELFNFHNSLIKLHEGKTIKEGIKLTSIEDPNMTHVKNNINILKANIHVLDKDFLSGFFIQNDIKNQINTFIIHIDEIIPIALAGQSNLQHRNKKGRVSSIPVYLSIFPNDNHTYFIFSVKNRYFKKLDEILKLRKHPIKFLSFIESWLIYGSDTWFINESLLNSFSNTKKKQMLEDLYDLNQFPTNDLKYSIFDDVRIKILSEEMDKSSKLYKAEQKKLNFFNK